MNTVVEIDKAGRVLVPRKMRDALHLVPGTRLILQQQGECLVLRPEPRGRGLYKKKGTWVYDLARSLRATAKGGLKRIEAAAWTGCRLSLPSDLCQTPHAYRSIHPERPAA